MIRFLLILCGGSMFGAQAHAADSAIYIPVPYSTITLINAKTFQPDGVIQAGDTGSLALSADGKTLFTAKGGVNLCAWARAGNRSRNGKNPAHLPNHVPDLGRPGRLPTVPRST
jgi:hypothetical protein